MNGYCSISITVPLTGRLSSLSQKQTMLAISSGSMMSPAGANSAGRCFTQSAGYLMADSAFSHRYIGSDYNAGSGAPVGKDIGVQPVAITTARVRFSF